MMKKVVGARGFEPPTPCSQSRCATRLRYTPTNVPSTGDAPAAISDRPRRRLVEAVRRQELLPLPGRSLVEEELEGVAV